MLKYVNLAIALIAFLLEFALFLMAPSAVATVRDVWISDLILVNILFFLIDTVEGR